MFRVSICCFQKWRETKNKSDWFSPMIKRLGTSNSYLQWLTWDAKKNCRTVVGWSTAHCFMFPSSSTVALEGTSNPPEIPVSDWGPWHCLRRRNLQPAIVYASSFMASELKPQAPWDRRDIGSMECCAMLCRGVEPNRHQKIRCAAFPSQSLLEWQSCVLHAHHFGVVFE